MAERSDSRLVSSLETFSQGAGVVVFIVGLVVFFGWMLDIPTLKSLHPSLVTMKANTATSFILIGASLWLMQTKRVSQRNRRIAQGCALVVALVGLLTLGEHLFGWDLRIDQLLFKEPAGAVGTSSPGRMAPNTALNFLLIGIALLRLDAKDRRDDRTNQLLILIAGMIALLGLLGYVYGISAFFGIASYTRMALHTAVAFIVSCLGILSARPDRGLMSILTSEGAGGSLARRLLPAAIGIPFVLGWLSLVGQRAGLYNIELGLSLVVVSSIVIFAVLIWRSAGPLDIADKALRRANEEIIGGADALSSSVSQISAAATQLASSAAETATAVSQTTTTVEEVKQTAQVSSQKAKYVSESAQKAAQVSQSGRKSVEESIEIMNRIREQMGSIAESIVRLSEQSQAIGEIIATVNDLTDQSNLLAVNAAIEAAKAGEQGKGFAVVAGEVRSLAEQSKQATAQVRAILSDIQKATSAAVMATEQGSKAVEAGVKQSADVVESIRMLANSVSESAQAATQIAASSQQQLVGMDQVASAMENIKQASSQNVASTKQTEAAAQSLHELGQKLKQLVEQYKV
jgi:methyl-accepting chemotaxis protein